MRLIDADEIEYTKFLNDLGNGMYEDIFIVSRSSIDNQPTVDAVPVLCGELQDEGKEYEMNELNELRRLIDEFYENAQDFLDKAKKSAEKSGISLEDERKKNEP